MTSHDHAKTPPQQTREHDVHDRSAKMRSPLRALRAAGLRRLKVHEASKHTEIRLEGGGLLRLHRGNRMSRRFERGLRTSIRKVLECERILP